MKDRMMLSPQSCPHLNPLEPGKGEFEDVVNLRILKWGDDPGLLRWVLITGRQEDQSQRGDEMMETGIGMMHLEEGGRGLHLLCSKVGPLVLCSVMQDPVWVDEHRART